MTTTINLIELLARAKRLRNELDDSNANLDRKCVTAMFQMEQALEAQAKQIEELQADAERWREWRKGKAITVVCKNSTIIFAPHRDFDYPKQLDAAIDAAPVAPAQPVNEWKDAVLSELAEYALDAPVSTPPAEIIKLIISTANKMAIDPAISAQPVNELVELGERFAKLHTNGDIWITTIAASSMVEAALANTKAAQPFTREQAYKVLELLLKAAEHLMPDGHKYQGEAIEIMERIRG